MNWVDRRKGQFEKFGNRSSVCQLGHSHRSKLESSVCQMIQFRVKAGELELLQVEAHVYLTRARILYIPDFKCRDLKSGELVYIEAKGFKTRDFALKKRLWKFYSDSKLEIWGGNHINPKLMEEIVPEREIKYE